MALAILTHPAQALMALTVSWLDLPLAVEAVAVPLSRLLVLSVVPVAAAVTLMPLARLAVLEQPGKATRVARTMLPGSALVVAVAHRK